MVNERPEEEQVPHAAGGPLPPRHTLRQSESHHDTLFCVCACLHAEAWVMETEQSIQDLFILGW